MVNKWSTKETVFVVWVGIALVVLIPITAFLHASFPVFTVMWLVVPLLAVVLNRDANRVGFRAISWRALLTTSAFTMAGLFLVSLLVEPWSHAYQALVREAVSHTPPDTTFAWLVRFDGATEWAGLLVYSGFVTIFAEELFFRGWLLQGLQHKMNAGWAIVIQAVLFTLPQLIAALLLSPVQAVTYTLGYSFLAVGVVGGWAAARTQSIWPSLASATIWNAIMVAWIL